jgi:predicted SnoaL-like aldol condensation-catalyzing enzyme
MAYKIYFYIYLLASALLPAHELQGSTLASQEQANAELILNMLHNVSEEMNSDAVADYFTKDFELISNNSHHDYKAFVDHLNSAFKNLKAISFKKPIADVVAQNNKVAIRSTIITTDKEDNSVETDFIAIFHIENNKIHQWWELTYPDWQQKSD